MSERIVRCRVCYDELKVGTIPVIDAILDSIVTIDRDYERALVASFYVQIFYESRSSELSTCLRGYEKYRGKECKHSRLKLTLPLYGTSRAVLVYCSACIKLMDKDVLPKTYALIDEYTDMVETERVWKAVSGKKVSLSDSDKLIKKIKRYISRRV